MAIYDAYAARGRIKAGVAIKERQARRMFNLGNELAQCAAQSILEIGPGDGYIAKLASAGRHPYLAVEGSPAVADKLTAEGHRVLPVYVPPVPQSVGTGYRCCFMLHVIEHMKEPAEAAALVGELRATLAPGGILAIACPDYMRWGSYFYDCDYTHALPMTRRRLGQLLRDQGLEVLYETVYTGPVFGYSGLPLSWLAKLLYSPLLDELIGPKRFGDKANRGFLTFLPNLFSVARRPLE